MSHPAGAASDGGGGHDPAPSALPAAPGRLKRRAEFLHVGKGRRWHGRAMTVQMAPRLIEEPGAPPDPDRSGGGVPRFGFTLTKKVGNAVVRNRARRRLREAVRLATDLPARPGHDYVVVGRIDAIRLPFAQLLGELARAVERVHSAEAQRGGGRPKRRS